MQIMMSLACSPEEHRRPYCVPLLSAGPSASCVLRHDGSSDLESFFHRVDVFEMDVGSFLSRGVASLRQVRLVEGHHRTCADGPSRIEEITDRAKVHIEHGRDEFELVRDFVAVRTPVPAPDDLERRISPARGCTYGVIDEWRLTS